MPEAGVDETGGGAPAALDIAKKPETRDSRGKVVDAFNNAFTLFERDYQPKLVRNLLTKEENWAFRAIKSAKRKTLDQGKDTFTNTFKNPKTSETFTQEEGIPIEDLLAFLEKRLKGLPPDSPERQNIINWGHALYRNSQPFSRLPHRLEPSRFVERVRQEAYLISQDARATHDPRSDWFKAENTLNKRLELVIPPERPVTSGPTIITELEESPRTGPAIWSNKDSDTPVTVTGYLGKGPDGRMYVSVEGSTTGVPLEEIKFPPDTEEETSQSTTGVAKPGEGREPEAEFQPETIQQRSYNIEIITAQESVSKLSHIKAREQINKLLRTGKWWQIWHWPWKVGLRLTEGGFLQFLKGRLQRAMNAQNSSLLAMADVRKTAGELTEVREKAQAEQRSVVERFKLGGLKTGEQQVKTQGELRAMLIDEILRPITTGQISNPDQVREQLAVFVKNHLADPQVRALFGPEANDFGDLAEYFATDVLEMGLRIKADMETRHETFEQIDQYINIRLGYAGLGAQQETRDFVDKAVAWAKRKRSASLVKGAKGLGFAGVILNPFVVGVATSLGTAGGLYALGITGRVAQLSSLGVGTVLGAAAAGLRRRYELGVYDRPTHLVERTLGGQIPPTGAPRREALERFAYETASVDQLLNGGGQELTTGTQRQSLQELLSQDLSASQITNRANVVRRIAEIKTRRDFSARERVDLVTFEARERVEQGRLSLVKAVVEARQALRNAGMPETEIADLENRFTGEWNQRFIQNREQQDKEFNSYRTKQALKAAAFGGAAGFAGGLVGQQVLAEIGRHIPITPDTFILGGLFRKGQTALEGFLGREPTAPSIDTFRDLYPQGGKLNLGADLQVNTNPDHSISIIDTVTSQPVPDLPKIVLGADGHMNATGAIPQGLHDELQQSGFQIEQGPDITQARTITEQRPILGPEGEWTKEATHIDSREWYSYDQPGSQGNELRFYTHKSGSEVILDMTNMEQGYQRGLAPNPIDVQEVIRNHEAVWYFSGPKFPHEGIAVFDGADGTWDGQLHLDPNANPNLHINPADPKSMTLAEFSKIVLNQEALQKLPDGNIATELYGRQGVFDLAQEGKMGFIEAGRIVHRDGQDILQAFATIRGGSPLPDTIRVAKEILQAVHTYDIIPPEAIAPPEAPPIIPIAFAPRHPLEPLRRGVAEGEYPEGLEYAEHLGGLEYGEPTGEYGEYGEWVTEKGELKPVPKPSFNTLEERAQAEKENTSETLVEERIRTQEDYVESLRRRYNLENPNPTVRRMLYRLNGLTKGYLEELEEVNRSLPLMSEKTKLSIVIPAYNEEGRIEQTLRGWINQQETTGEPFDPKSVEFLILVNRPNESREFDRTAAIINSLKNDPAFASFNIHVVQKTFNFPDEDTTTKGGVSVLKGVRMGLIYKYAADLAVLRNLARQDGLRRANHLVRTGGADTHARNPQFLSRVFSWFDGQPGLEQYVSRSDYPPAVYEKLPLLHVAQRLNEMMNVQFTKKQSHIGLGTYRAGIYAASGGFNPGMDVREEIDLSQRMRRIIKKKEASGVTARKRETIINALDDPRRAIATILAGRPITQLYAEWTNEEIRKIDISDVLKKPVPPRAQLTRENLQGQVRQIFQFYFRQILASPSLSRLSQEERVERAYNLAHRYLKRSLAVLGIDNYEIGYSGNIKADITKAPLEIAQNCYVRIGDISGLEGLIRGYAGRRRPEWMDIRKPPSKTSPPGAEPTIEPQPKPPKTTSETLAAEAATAPEVSLVSGIGFSEAQGSRSTMEDAHAIVENFGGNPNWRFLAIYDGHGGRAVADHATQRLHENLLAQLSQGVDPKESLPQAYLKTDEEIKQAGIGRNSGTTAVTALIQGNKLFIANVGDARAVLNRGGGAERLSYDHKVTDPQEKERIVVAGGKVENGYMWVEGEGLAVARALGDQEFKNFVVAEPYLREIDLKPEDSFLILACDGVWDVMSDQEAVDFIKSETDPQRASKKLRDEALRRAKEREMRDPKHFLGDNISVAVIQFGQQERPVTPVPPIPPSPPLAETPAATEAPIPQRVPINSPELQTPGDMRRAGYTENERQVFQHARYFMKGISLDPAEAQREVRTFLKERGVVVPIEGDLEEAVVRVLTNPQTYPILPESQQPEDPVLSLASILKAPPPPRRRQPPNP